MKQIIMTVALVMLLIGSSAAQQANKHIGALPEASTPNVKLDELLKTPEVYRGKDVVLKGIYGGACGDGDYFFKDKFDMVEFTLDQGGDIEKFKTGTPIQLYGKVKVRTSESKEATVSVEGKGIEY
ncbi:MAG: hypothetical protein KGJ11_00420 [Candidatus Omnitrophica bacterium]|nr:hypothetical protein [Candidatus Omnitrophota bacterium]